MAASRDRVIAVQLTSLVVSDRGRCMPSSDPAPTLLLMADQTPTRPLLTKRRSVDLCRVTTCLCR